MEMMTKMGRRTGKSRKNPSLQCQVKPLKSIVDNSASRIRVLLVSLCLGLLTWTGVFSLGPSIPTHQASVAKHSWGDSQSQLDVGTLDFRNQIYPDQLKAYRLYAVCILSWSRPVAYSYSNNNCRCHFYAPSTSTHSQLKIQPPLQVPKQLGLSLNQGVLLETPFHQHATIWSRQDRDPIGLSTLSFV